MMKMSTSIKTENDITVAKINGDLDHHTAKFIRGEIDREIAAEHPVRLIIDFSEVTFMDSSGIGLIMGRYKLMQDLGGDVVVASPPAYIKKVLRLAGIDKLTRIVGDVRSAMPHTTPDVKENGISGSTEERKKINEEIGSETN